MKRTALVAVPPPATPFSPVPSPLPSSGVASVTTLSTERNRRRRRSAAVPSEQAVLIFPEARVPAPPAGPRLRLVTGEDTGLERFAARFAQAVVEVIGGDRGVYQLMRWTTDEVYADLDRRSSALQRTGSPAPARTRRLRAQVRSVHLSLPQPGVAELSIHVRHGARSRAIAARIELIEGRWRCSALEFG